MTDQALFWAKLAALGQIAGAAATFLAVVAALLLARAERQLKIRVSAALMHLVNQMGATPIIAVEVENIGLRKVRVTGIGWSTGFFRWLFVLPKFLRARTCHQIPDYTWAINENFPWELEPGQSKTTSFRREEFLQEFRIAQPNDLFRKLLGQKRHVLFRHRVHAGVYTKRGVVLGKVDPKLTRLLEENYEPNSNP